MSRGRASAWNRHRRTAVLESRPAACSTRSDHADAQNQRRESLLRRGKKARQFDVKVAPEWLNGGSNPTDDGMTRVLEDYKDDPTLMELRSYLRAMNEDELEDLLGLTLLGATTRSTSGKT